MAVKQLPKLSEIPEPPDRLVGDQKRFDVITFDSLKAQKKMVNEDLNKTFIPKLNEFAAVSYTHLLCRDAPRKEHEVHL